MSNINKIGNRRIRIKTKRIAKVKEIKIVESNNTVYIEFLPEYKKDLSSTEINNYYLAFLELGRTLYHENKDNISKIKFNKYEMENHLDNRYILKNEPKQYAEESIYQYIEQWANQNHIWFMEDTTKYNNFFFIKSNDSLRLENLTKWLEDNFAPVEVETGDGAWLYINYQKLIDLAIFIYLVTYAIKSMKTNNLTKGKDYIKFADFIELNIDGLKEEEIDNKIFIKLIVDVITMFEMNNISQLYGYNKLIYLNDENRFEMTTEYDDIYAVIWYVFKLYLVDNFSYYDANDKRIPINICDCCGKPFIGTTIFCNDCELHRSARRQAKCRQEKFNNFNKIKELINDYQFPKYLTKEANQLLKMTNTQIYKCKKSDIDNLLYQLKSYINKKN